METDMTLQSKNAETLVLHSGPRHDAATGAVAVPIFQTTSYQFKSTEHAASLFALKEFGHIYSRLTNPTNEALEQRMAALEGGVMAMAVSSGQAASAIAIQNLCRPGDNIVSSTDLYGGTWNLFANTLPSMGIEVRFADPVDPESFRRVTDARTRAYYAETLPNPKLAVFPIGEVAAIGRALGVPLIMDNTAAPMICKPLEHGAAIVVHSTTKYIGGHGTSIGGVIIDGGNFDWAADAKRFPTLNEPDQSYHGAVWTEAVKPLGPIAYILRARAVLLRDVGSCMSPFSAFQFIQGLETMPLRMREHCRNANDVAHFLQRHPAVKRVIFAGMHKDPEQRRRALHRCTQDVLPRGQHRRRALACHPSGEHHALAAQCRRSTRERRDTGLCAPLRGHRAYRRHHCRPGSGARRSDGHQSQGGLEQNGPALRIRRRIVPPRPPECPRPDDKETARWPPYLHCRRLRAPFGSGLRKRAFGCGGVNLARCWRLPLRSF
jgi:O-acetylhomoserine (thiol)-lyase